MNETIKIAIVGIGNCASSLMQGINHYKNVNEDKYIGLLNYKIGNYKPYIKLALSE